MPDDNDSIGPDASERRKGGFLSRLFRPKASEHSLREALEEVLDEHNEEASKLAPEEKVMLRNMLSFGEITVHDIMIARGNIDAVEYSMPLAALQRHFIEQRHTRVPVYEDSLDNIKGIIHSKDIIPFLSCAHEPKPSFEISKILRQTLFVPPSMRIGDLLLKMRLSGIHMAIVVDEYGGTDGLVTLEDLFEEIVGEIEDEHDEIEDFQRLNVIRDNLIEVDGRIPITTLESELGLSFTRDDEEQEFDTLGGYIFHKLGRVPVRGEIITHESGFRCEVTQVDPRRVRKVYLHLPKA